MRHPIAGIGFGIEFIGLVGFVEFAGDFGVVVSGDGELLTRAQAGVKIVSLPVILFG